MLDMLVKFRNEGIVDSSFQRKEADECQRSIMNQRLKRNMLHLLT